MATMHYWPIKARGYPNAVIAKAAGVALEWKGDADLAADKEAGVLPFGQWPYVKADGLNIGQSGAIMRYFSRKGGLDGASDAEYALGEMLMCEAEDVWGQLTKALYEKTDGSNAPAYDKLFAADGWFAKHAACLEKLIPGTGPFFSAGEKRLGGSYYLACVLDVATSIEPACLDATPKLKAFLAAMLALPAFEGTSTLHNYCKKD